MGGNHEGVRVHYVFRRVSIIGTVIKSPVEGHGGHIADCAQLESAPFLTDCVIQIRLHRSFNRILVHYLQVIHFARYEYFFIYLSIVIFHTIFINIFGLINYYNLRYDDKEHNGPPYRSLFPRAAFQFIQSTTVSPL